MRKIAISTNEAPRPVGNYSQAISTQKSYIHIRPNWIGTQKRGGYAVRNSRNN